MNVHRSSKPIALSTHDSSVFFPTTSFFYQFHKNMNFKCVRNEWIKCFSDLFWKSTNESTFVKIYSTAMNRFIKRPSNKFMKKMLTKINYEQTTFCERKKRTVGLRMTLLIMMIKQTAASHENKGNSCERKQIHSPNHSNSSWASFFYFSFLLLLFTFSSRPLCSVSVHYSLSWWKPAFRHVHATKNSVTSNITSYRFFFWRQLKMKTTP